MDTNTTLHESTVDACSGKHGRRRMPTDIPDAGENPVQAALPPGRFSIALIEGTLWPHGPGGFVNVYLLCHCGVDVPDPCYAVGGAREDVAGAGGNWRREGAANVG